MTQKANEVAKATTGENQANTQVVQKAATVVDQVTERIGMLTNAGDIVLPTGYSAGNAVRAAWLYLQDKPELLTGTTTASQVNALFKMAIKGMSVIKKHGNFIKRADKLYWEEEYQGEQMIAKRDCNVLDFNPVVVYEQDDFSYEIDVRTGIKRIVKHTQSLDNIDNNKIKGAYCVAIFRDGTTKTDIMTMNEIRTSWQQGAARGNSPAHQKFTQEMCKKTVIRRLCKAIINSTPEAIPSLTDADYADKTDPAAASVKTTLATKANKEVVDFADAEVVDDQPPATTTAATASTTAEPAPAATAQPDLFAGNQEGPGF